METLSSSQHKIQKIKQNSTEYAYPKHANVFYKRRELKQITPLSLKPIYSAERKQLRSYQLQILSK